MLMAVTFVLNSCEISLIAAFVKNSPGLLKAFVKLNPERLERA